MTPSLKVIMHAEAIFKVLPSNRLRFEFFVANQAQKNIYRFVIRDWTKSATYGTALAYNM